MYFPLYFFVLLKIQMIMSTCRSQWKSYYRFEQMARKPTRNLPNEKFGQLLTQSDHTMRSNKCTHLFTAAVGAGTNVGKDNSPTNDCPILRLLFIFSINHVLTSVMWKWVWVFLLHFWSHAKCAHCAGLHNYKLNTINRIFNRYISLYNLD